MYFVCLFGKATQHLVEDSISVLSVLPAVQMHKTLTIKEICAPSFQSTEKLSVAMYTPKL